MGDPLQEPVEDNLFDSETYSGIEKRNVLQSLSHRPKYFFQRFLIFSNEVIRSLTNYGTNDQS